MEFNPFIVRHHRHPHQCPIHAIIIHSMRGSEYFLGPYYIQGRTGQTRDQRKLIKF